MDSPTRHHEVTLTRSFKAPRALVFKAWTTTEHIKRWFCPNAYSVPEAIVEPRVGGRFEVCMRSPEGIEHWSRGCFTELVPLERLAFEGSIPGPSGAPLFDARTVVRFSGEGTSTRVDVTQTYTIHDPAALPMIQGAPVGWNQPLDRLEAELGRMLGGDATARSVVHAMFTVARTYDAPRARVWRALTDADAKARWFAGAPGKWQLLERAMDVRPGGRERLKGRWEGGMVSTFDAVYCDVIADERLVYAYEMQLDDRKISVSLATLQLGGDGDKTTLTVTEQGAFLDGYDDAGAREHGTGLLLDALGASLRD